ncbi:MAG: long-chain fatty acid--CoA ligase [Aureliella sp.]
MQTGPNNLISILEHAACFHGNVEVVSCVSETVSPLRTNYRTIFGRANQLAHALDSLGLNPGDRVATLAWNTHRHLEAWYAIAGQGLVCHTVNPRLPRQHLQFIMEHAEDRVVMVDADLMPTLVDLLSDLPRLEHVVVLSAEPQSAPIGHSVQWHVYEDWIAPWPEAFAWPELEADAPSGLCYTSGTTGQPRGVLYTHRSNLHHAGAVNESGALGMSSSDCVLMVVPMFHANSWGIAYSAPMAGAKLVLPGRNLDAMSLCNLLSDERVTFGAAVPAIWSRVLERLVERNQRLPDLREVISGGSAVPATMIETFREHFGVNVLHAWGMTEMSPMGTMCRLKHHMFGWSKERQVRQLAKQGLPPFGLQLRIVNDAGEPMPHNGRSMGHVQTKGPWVIDRYFKEDQPCVDTDGWFSTGDVGTIDTEGFLEITDRSKDLVKSGGEWISSVQLETVAMGCPGVHCAAVIAVPDEHWQERPLMLIEETSHGAADIDEVRSRILDAFPKWWLPKNIGIVGEIPLTSIGKIDKKALRAKWNSDAKS